MMKKILIALLATSFLTLTAYPVPHSAAQDQSMHMQIIKADLEFTKASFASIKIEPLTNDQYAVQVKLTPDAAKKFADLTTVNIHGVLQIIFGKQVISVATIQSSLGDNFLLTGFNKQQAEAFVKAMGS